MIVVVEAISAAGKTTWCRKHAEGQLVAETFPEDRHAQPALGRATAEYWTEWNTKRWREALSVEQSTGCAVCDTDPLKLYYVWGLFRIGEIPESQWHLMLDSTRRAIAGRRLGFADLYIVNEIEPDIARLQRDRDTTRIRDRFELHLRLQEPLLTWYRALEASLGGHVIWGLPSVFPDNQILSNNLRYDLRKFHELISSLPGGPLIMPRRTLTP